MLSLALLLTPCARRAAILPISPRLAARISRSPGRTAWRPPGGGLVARRPDGPASGSGAAGFESGARAEVCGGAEAFFLRGERLSGRTVARGSRTAATTPIARKSLLRVIARRSLR